MRLPQRRCLSLDEFLVPLSQVLLLQVPLLQVPLLQVPLLEN